MEQYAPLGLFLLFFIMGIVCSILSYKHHILPSLRSKEWPTAKGIVFESYLNERGAIHSSNIVMYEPIVGYKYKVNGKEYESYQVKLPNLTTSNLTEAEKLLSEYEVDATVGVHYNPENPEQATLKAGLGSFEPLTLVPLFFVFIGLIGGPSYWFFLLKK